MVQTTTTLDVADNSGAKKIMCIRVLGGTRRKYASIGDIESCGGLNHGSGLYASF